MISMTTIVRTYGGRLPARAAVRVWKQWPSVQLMTAGFTTDHNSTGVSATGHRYRQ